jgi:transposase
MLHAIIGGETDGAVLAGLARGVLRKKEPQLIAALTGTVHAHQRFLLGQMLARIRELEATLARCDEEIARAATAYRDVQARLETIPGVGRRGAETILSEIGLDMTRFPSAAHLASWARICPGNHESAGKRMSGRTGRGNNWLKAALLEAAWVASRTRGTYLAAQYQGVARRRGVKRAAIAVAHSILVAAYYILRDQVAYRDLGPDHFDRLHRQRLTRYHVRRLADLGFGVTLAPTEAVA